MLAERIATTAPKFAAVLQGIHSRAPSARVCVLKHPAIPAEAHFGCWPQMPLGFLVVPHLRATEKRLNSMLATPAAANGAILVDGYSASIGHDAYRSIRNSFEQVPDAPISKFVLT